MNLEFRAITPKISLTDRQLEILYLCALGFSAEKIAEQIKVSPATVRFHLSRIRERSLMSTRGTILSLAINNRSFRKKLAKAAEESLPQIDLVNVKFSLRELEVLRFIHLTDRKLAKKICVSPDAVHHRFEGIRRKLEVKNQRQVILRIIQLAILNHPQIIALYPDFRIIADST